MGVSAFDRLKLHARVPGQDFNLTLTRYGCERLLYRLSRSPHRHAFMLKGATLFAVWEEAPHRPTRDVDLLGFGEDSAERLRDVFADVCRQEVEDDGVVFDPDSISVIDIREGQAYQGKRLAVRGLLGTAKLNVQVDVGFGDAVAGQVDEVVLPTLLDFPAPRLRAYPVEVVVAEKLHAMAQHGMLNSRMKDIFDVQALAERVEFDGPRLCEAIRATFERRGLPIGADLPAALTPAFAGDAVMRGRWDAFLSRNRLDGTDLVTAVGDARRFVNEPWMALARGAVFVRRWPPGGPWSPPPGV
jgi:predicted nucleotidyltransferase component of viral defense system